jgi:hypothetical protein
MYPGMLLDLALPLILEIDLILQKQITVSFKRTIYPNRQILPMSGIWKDKLPSSFFGSFDSLW